MKTVDNILKKFYTSIDYGNKHRVIKPKMQPAELTDLVKDPNKITNGSVLYCGNGHKSMAAASFLKNKGINVKDIIGGLSAMLVDAPELEI